DYTKFAQEILREIPDRPISFEVFADDLVAMKEQALKFKQWGENVYVKIPISTTDGSPTLPLIRDLVMAQVKLNVTAIMTLEQVRGTAEAMQQAKSGVISIFAGRIADTGRDPVPLMREA